MIKKLFLFVFAFLLINNLFSFSVSADTTFFDNPDDFFIMNDFADDSRNGVGCVPLWECTEWSFLKVGYRERECFDLNKCDTDYQKPSDSEKLPIKYYVIPLFILFLLVIIMIYFCLKLSKRKRRH